MGFVAKILFAILVAILAIFLIGANDDPGIVEVETKMSTAFEVGLMNKGSFETLGTITFDKDNIGELSLQATGEVAENLEKAWAEVAVLDKLFVRRSERVKNEAGHMVMNLIGVNVERSSPDYPLAAIEYLSNKYGYFGKPEG